jgi:hypothetical protein
VLGGIKMNNNIEYIILVDFELEDNLISNSDFTWNLGKVSEKEAFKLYYERLDLEAKEYKESFNSDYIYELRQYDTIEDDYLDWDMTDSEYYKEVK